MLRVYLDQNKWIDLARAATGHTHGDRFAEALDVARDASSSGAASFPLDIYRYLETGKRANNQSRTALADVMFDISRQDTLARPHTVLPAEVDQGLQRIFGYPEHPRQAVVFGKGLRHITDGEINWPSLNHEKVATENTMGPGDLANLVQIYDQLVERELLRVGPDEVRAAGFDPSERAFGEQFVENETRIAAEIRSRGLSGELLDLAVRASDLGGIRSVVTEALNRIGIQWEEFIALMGPGRLVEFMDDLPSRFVTNVMRTSKTRLAHEPWEPNDFNDLAALPVAAVYCDVVITEKQWVHRLRRGNIEDRYKTILLSDTADLVPVLSNL